MDKELIFWVAAAAIGAIVLIAALLAAKRVGREYISWIREGVE